MKLVCTENTARYAVNGYGKRRKTVRMRVKGKSNGHV